MPSVNRAKHIVQPWTQCQDWRTVHTRLAGTVLLIMSTISPMTVLADPQEDHAEHPPVPYMPAEPIISDDVATVADQTGVDAVDLQGAVNTTGTDPTEYAYGTGLLK